MTKVIRPKPGVYRGIKMRSQLEIAWARWFDSVEANWEYVDGDYCDFRLDGQAIEIKPRVASLVWSAIKRWWLCRADLTQDAEIESNLGNVCGIPAYILCGSPPSKYGNPALLVVTVCRGGLVLLCVDVVSNFSDGILTIDYSDWGSFIVTDENKALLRISELIGEEA